MKISFCIITLNEEENLGRCLQSCHDLADEILVVDSGSVDGTEAIARGYGTRWKHQEWLGYVGQKNLAISSAGNPWVFSLDADEELSPMLREEIRLIRDGPSTGVAGYSMPRCVLYEGRWIRHGDWYPDRLVRLFQRDKACFTGGRVHERLQLDGVVERLRGDLFHYSFKDSADHRERGRRYARLWAETQFENGRRIGRWAPILHSIFRWFRCYLLRGGFLDGRQGWRIAQINSAEVLLKYRLLYEMGLKGQPEQVP